MRSIAVAVLLGAAVMCAMVGSGAAANCNVEAAACADSFHACNLATPYETCSTCMRLARVGALLEIRSTRAVVLLFSPFFYDIDACAFPRLPFLRPLSSPPWPRAAPEGCYKSYLQCMLGVCKDDDSLFLEAKDACLGACPAVSFVCDRAAPLTPSWVVPLFVASLAAAGAAVLGAAAA